EPTRNGTDHAIVLDEWKELNEGFMSDVRLDSSGTLELDQISCNIIDEYVNDDHIQDIGSMTLDTESGVIKQALMKTYGYQNREVLRGSMQTSDGGVMLLGSHEYLNSTGYYVQMSYIVKMDPAGSVVWEQEFNFAKNTFPYGAVEAPNGDYLITGMATPFQVYTQDVFIARITSSGQQIWNTTIDINATETPKEIMISGTDRYMIIGEFNTGLNQSYFLLEIDGSGNEIFNVTGPSHPQFVLEDAIECIGGGYLITGSYRGDFYVYQGCLIKVNADGDLVWEKEFGNRTYGDDYLTAIQQVGSGDIYLSGYTYSYASSYPSDIWLIKTDSNGVESWNRTYDTFTNERVTSMVAHDGEITIAGTDLSSSYPDVLIMNINSDGNMDWYKKITGQRNDEPVEIFKTTSGIIVTGNTDSYGEGAYDYFLVKLNDTGAIDVAPLISTDLMEGIIASSVYQFEVVSYISAGSKVLVSFSDDGAEWFDSTGQIDAWDEIISTPGRINLFDDGWPHEAFHYRIKIQSSGSDDSQIGSIKLKYRVYAETGSYISPIFEKNGPTRWSMLNWTGDIPEGTNITYQVRSANDMGHLDQKSFIGPNGSMGDLYEMGESINESHSGRKMFQFKMFFNTTGPAITPTISSIRIYHNGLPELMDGGVDVVLPDITQEVTFTVCYQDLDGDLPDHLFTNVDGVNYTMEGNVSDDNVTDGRVYTFNSTFSYGIHTYHFLASDGMDACRSENMTFSVRMGPVDSIEITSDSFSFTTDEMIKFNATCMDADGNTLQETPNWDVSGGGVISPDGRFDPMTVGTFTVYAALSDVTASAPINISAGEPVWLTIVPAEAEITTDEYVRFDAPGSDADGNTMEMDVQWEVSGGGTIDTTGNFTASEPGNYIVYANSSKVSAQTTISISTGLPSAITVTGDRSEVNIGEKIRFTAVVTDADGNAIEIDILWSVDGGGLITLQGLFTANTAGDHTATASYGGILGTASFKVLGSSSVDDDDDDDDGTSEKGINPLFLVIPIVLVVIIVIVIFLLLLGRRKGEPEKEEVSKEKDLYSDLPDIEEEVEEKLSAPLSDDWMSVLDEAPVSGKLSSEE
ncbi:MAG: hypothetical protein U9R75_05610, partial [Candidatus Thermoplasmatota archaeon]|nr:hypothetical protein [Candidatus Thermoplasmatota archaeon]